MAYFEPLSEYVKTAIEAEASIADDRKMLLENAASKVSQMWSNNGKVLATFICTHNSRRSHLAQIWAQLAAWQFNVPMECFSGGTEATAFYPSAVAALASAGCHISREGDQNPCYEVCPDDHHVIRTYSKRFDDPANPSENFIAFMTCPDADQNCPVVLGATHRISLYYDDPKVYDGTSEEQSKYSERCFQIATEMYYMMSKVSYS
jgi:arsenate reductase